MPWRWCKCGLPTLCNSFWQSPMRMLSTWRMCMNSSRPAQSWRSWLTWMDVWFHLSPCLKDGSRLSPTYAYKVTLTWKLLWRESSWGQWLMLQGNSFMMQRFQRSPKWIKMLMVNTTNPFSIGMNCSNSALQELYHQPRRFWRCRWQFSWNSSSFPTRPSHLIGNDLLSTALLQMRKTRDPGRKEPLTIFCYLSRSMRRWWDIPRTRTCWCTSCRLTLHLSSGEPLVAWPNTIIGQLKLLFHYIVPLTDFEMVLKLTTSTSDDVGIGMMSLYSLNFSVFEVGFWVLEFGFILCLISWSWNHSLLRGDQIYKLPSHPLGNSDSISVRNHRYSSNKRWSEIQHTNTSCCLVTVSHSHLQLQIPKAHNPSPRWVLPWRCACEQSWTGPIATWSWQTGYQHSTASTHSFRCWLLILNLA